MDAISSQSSLTSSSATIDCASGASAHDEQQRPAPLLWQHPHIIGSVVLEDPRGQPFLLFKHYGLSAWTRRVAWRCGTDMLHPLDSTNALVLGEYGYNESC